MLFDLEGIQPELGYCFTAPIAAHIEGDDPGSPSRSSLILLEDGVPIGRPHQLHDDIRRAGGGLFSHWEGTLYFSASDNGDPTNNGRTYHVLMYDRRLDPVPHHDLDVINEIVDNANRSNSVINNYFRSFGAISNTLEHNGLPRAPQSVLEIGTGPTPLLALRFLLEGTQRYIANDIGPVTDRFAPQFVAALTQASGALGLPCTRHFDQMFEPTPNGDYRARGLETATDCPIENLTAAPVAFVVSVSALEHVRHPEAAVQQIARLLQPDGYCYHSIDLRYHADFERPLEFLKMTDAEWDPVATENRLRSSDWLALFERYGFEVIDRWEQTLDPDEVERERRDFVEPYRSKSVPDLSVICLQVLCRRSKPGQGG